MFQIKAIYVLYANILYDEPGFQLTIFSAELSIKFHNHLFIGLREITYADVSRVFILSAN
jgi:hypothetical protein